MARRTEAITTPCCVEAGIRRTGSNALALVTGGTDRLKLSGSGAELVGKLTGTAVVQSDTDTTAGRIMTVGHLGLGATTAPLVPSGDLDTLLVGGIYRVSGAVTNTPYTTGPTGSVVLVMPFGATNVAQLFVRGAAPTALWLRYMVSGSWGAWQRLYSTASLLGTVSQSGGAPTGAVIEAGSNANGEYTRFADGTQICTRTLTIDPTITGAQTFNFPAAFASGVVKSVSIGGGGGASRPTSGTGFGARWRGLMATAVGSNSNTAWEVTCSPADFSWAADSFSARLSAIGRWF